jgi:hypothetical protein
MESRMSAHPRDAFERQANPEKSQVPTLGWLAFCKLGFVASCTLTVAIDHVATKYHEVSELAEAIDDGEATIGPLAAMVFAWLLVALAVVLAREWTELRRHFSPYLAMAAQLIKRVYQKLINP